MGTPWQSSSCKFSKIFRIPLRNFVRSSTLVASQHVPYEYTTSYVEDQVSTNFYVIFTYFFNIISMVKKPTSFHTLFWKIHVASTYLFRCDFSGRKIHLVNTYFFWRNFDGRKVHVVRTYFLWQNFDEQKFDFAS